MRCGIYVRVSTDDQRDNGYSIDSQLRMIKEYCEKNDYERDLEKEKMIRLDTLNTVLKTKWNGMDKSEKQEFISKFIDTIEIKKDSKGNLILEKINFRNGFIRQLVKFYERGIFDVAVPVMVGNEEKTIKGGRMNEEQLDKYLSKMNEHFETSFYEMYETIDEETNEVILEYQPKENEKIIRFVAISSKEKLTKNSL